MISRFDYVPYDAIASEEQNRLRGHFKFLEGYVAKRWKGDIESIVIPNNEYRAEAGRAKTKLLDYINTDHLEEAFVQLDNLYTLLGKEIRLQCVKRIMQRKV
jgi:hypothetical protein